MSGIKQGAGVVPEGVKRLGDILVAQHVLDEFDLRCAMRVVKDHGKQLGDVLMENGMVTPAQIQRALEAQQRMQQY